MALQADVDVVDSVADATAVFTIMADVTGQRVVSVSAQNVPREYEVFYTVQYELNTPEATLLPERTQTTTRDYNWDETLVRALPDRLDPQSQEGFVVRLADRIEFDAFPSSIAKWVRRGHVQTDQHWMFAEIVPNGLAKTTLPDTP